MPKEAVLKTGNCAKMSAKMYVVSLLCLAAVGGGVVGQTGEVYPDHIWVPVIFYDFLASAQNPDFEPLGYGNGTHPYYGRGAPGMVQPLLSANRKPLLRQNLVHNANLERWFLPSGAPDAQFFFNPATSRWEWTNLVPFQGRTGEYVGSSWDQNEAMRNVVIYDSLRFTLYDNLWGQSISFGNVTIPFNDPNLLGRGVYVFGSSTFFPIDGRGLSVVHGADPPAYPTYDWINTGGHNYSFAMELHKEFTYRSDLVFRFVGDDDVFAFINGELAMDLGGIAFKEGAVNLDNLGLEDGEAYWFDFFYAERHVTGSNILLMTNLVAPSGIEDIVVTAQPPGDMCATDTKTLTARVLNESNEDVTAEFGAYITWTVQASDGEMGTSRLLSTSGPSVQFYAGKAHTSYTITATVVNPDDPSNVKSASLTFAVNPCYPEYTIIEQTSSPNNWIPAPRELLTITAGANTGELYAFLRDAENNLFGPATQAHWSTRDGAVVTVAPRSDNQSVGVVTRVANNESSTWVTAVDARTPLRPDSVRVQVVPWYPVRLKLVNGNDTSHDVSGGVVITTDVDQPLVVKGLQSNSDTANGQYIWTEVDVTWLLQTSTIALLNPVPQTSSERWTMSPTVPGSGTLQLRHAHPLTAPLDVPVIVNAGAVTGITIGVVDTSAVPPTAGIPFKTRVCIYGRHGTYPVDTCLTVTFADLLEGSVEGFPARWEYQGAVGELTEPVTLCFTGGCTEVEVVLFNAPENKAPHTIVVTQVGKPAITGDTGPFVLRPGELARLVLEYPTPGHRPLPDTIVLRYPDGVLSMVSVGYDRYGNVRGLELSNWSVSGTLRPPSTLTNTNRQFYDASEVIDDEEGRLTAAAVSNPSITDGVTIIMTGRGIALEVAYTRDFDANGYLDAIELHFNKPVTLPAGGGHHTGFTITDQATSTVFPVDSMVSRNGTDTDSVWTLYLREQRTDVPQTAWRPYVQIADVPGVEPIPGPTAFRTTDGAGPVIWMVVKYVSVPGDRSKDSVLVYFSESIVSDRGSVLGNDVLPEDLFRVYRHNRENASIEELPQLLVGIPGLNQVREGDYGTVVKFEMSNGNDLVQGYRLAINAQTARIQDDPVTQNVPAPHNQRVPVTQIGTHPNLTSGPNPSSAIFTRVPPGTLNPVHEPNARRWVRDDDAGVVISFELVIPTADNIVRVHIKVYDIAGNLVQSVVNNDVVAQLREVLTLEQIERTTVTVDMYWNGSTAQGMPAAPGLYRAVVYIDYADNTFYGDRREVTLIGIAK